MQLEYLPVLPQKMDYRIGLCGAGGIVNNAHLPAYRKAGFNVQCIYDKDRARAEETAAQFEIGRVCTSLAEMAAAVDIVDVAVPAQENAAVVAELAAAGVALLLQKPLAEDWQTAAQTVAQIRAHGVQAVEAHQPVAGGFARRHRSLGPEGRRAAALLVADHQLRHPHVGIGKLPQTQCTRGLGQARGDVDFAVAGGLLQLRQILKIAPAQLDVQGLGQ